MRERKAIGNWRRKYVVRHKWKSAAGTFEDDARVWNSEDAARFYISRILRRHGMDEKELKTVVDHIVKQSQSRGNFRMKVDDKDYYYIIDLKARSH